MVSQCIINIGRCVCKRATVSKMELFSKNVLGLSVLVLLPLVRGGCKEELMKNAEFTECFMNFGSFLANMGSSGTDMSDSDAMFKALCSPEGKGAINCAFGFINDCPDLMGSGSGAENPFAALESIPGLDFDMFMKEGGLDGVCAFMIGPCSKVKDCYIAPNGTMGPNGGMMKRSTVQGTDYYSIFLSHSTMMCGPMKEQMTCMVNALEACPASIVSFVEAEFEKALNMSTPDALRVTSYQDTKTFIQKECHKMPKDILQGTCAKSVITSLNFTGCSENITMEYSKARSCEVYALNKQCIDDHVQPLCGEETSMFLARNSHMIFPGIPNNCDMTDTSGSDVKKTIPGLLLISTIMTFLFFL